MRNKSDKYKLRDILQNNSPDFSEHVIIKDKKRLGPLQIKEA